VKQVVIQGKVVGIVRKYAVWKFHM
jgi:hypothetical protein